MSARKTKKKPHPQNKDLLLLRTFRIVLVMYGSTFITRHKRHSKFVKKKCDKRLPGQNAAATAYRSRVIEIWSSL